MAKKLLHKNLKINKTNIFEQILKMDLINSIQDPVKNFPEIF